MILAGNSRKRNFREKGAFLFFPLCTYLRLVLMADELLAVLVCAAAAQSLRLLVLSWFSANSCFSCSVRKQFSSGSSVMRVKYSRPAHARLFFTLFIFRLQLLTVVSHTFLTKLS
jgi:hypothetical protein